MGEAPHPGSGLDLLPPGLPGVVQLPAQDLPVQVVGKVPIYRSAILITLLAGGGCHTRHSVPR